MKIKTTFGVGLLIWPFVALFVLMTLGIGIWKAVVIYLAVGILVASIWKGIELLE